MEATLSNKSAKVMLVGVEPGDDGIKKAKKKEEWITKLRPVNVNKAHTLLDHPGEKALRQTTAKQFGWKLTGMLATVCEPCIKAKVTVKGTSKVNQKKAENPGQRLHLDLSPLQGDTLAQPIPWHGG